MNKTWSVLKNEFLNTVTRRSFIITLILVPLLPALILAGISLFGGDQSIDMIGGSFQPQTEEDLSEGFVDLADIITGIPEWLGPERLIAFTHESDAKQAALQGEINGFYVIQPDYLETGAIQYYRDDINPMTGLDSSGVINALIQYNLLGADQARFEAFQNPIQVEFIDLTPELDESIDMSNPIAFYIPYGMTMLFYILIVTSASLMLNSVAKEKENRVMEILVTSIKPKQLLTGKILGLGLVGLLQLVVWLGSALVLLRLGGTTLQIPPNLQLSPTTLIWGIVFFILGYLLYAALMAGVGALVGNVKEASQATFIIILPILIPLMMVGVIIEQPSAILPVILSLIPFTAPNTIMTRMAVMQVPIWQVLISMALLMITIILIIRAVAGMFRAQLLLTGQKFSLGLLLKALLGKHVEIAETSNISS
jgi:ABC-2 type transport system permease protein